MRITSLCYDQQGVLWIGTQREGLGRLVDDDFEAIALDPPNDLALFDIVDVREATDGSLWVAHADGVVQISAQGVFCNRLNLARLSPLQTAETEAFG